jgi:enterochelin esterase-like enzyme
MRGGGSRTVIAVTLALGAMMTAGAVSSVATARNQPVSAAVRAGRCAQAGTAVPPPSMTSLPGHVQSFVVRGHPVLAYVPAAYAAMPDAGFPVVYFLHGDPGSAGDWISPASGLPAILDGMIATGQLAPTIAVFPDGRRTGSDGSWWGDTAAGGDVETWLVHGLVPAVDSRYRTLGAGQRGVAGVSAGGLGALNVFLHHPGMFSWVASYSGVFTAPGGVFGASAAGDSPQLTVAGLPSDERVPLFVGGGAGDDEFLPETTRFVATVRSLGWAPLDVDIVPGTHGWEAWQTEAQASLVWLGRLWGTHPSPVSGLAAGTAGRSGCRS